MNTRKSSSENQAGAAAHLRSDRREFLGTTLGIGTGGLLASLGLAQYAAAQSSAPAAPATRG